VDSQRLGLDRQAVIQGLLEAVQMAREQANPAAMISGYVSLGKMLGLFAPERRQVEITAGDGRVRYETMSDADLSALIAPEAAAQAATVCHPRSG